MRTKIMECVECGCEFETNVHSGRTKYCIPCKRIVKKRHDRQAYEKRNQKLQVENKPEPVRSNTRIAECINRATELGMSYGSYMAMLREENAKT